MVNFLSPTLMGAFIGAAFGIGMMFALKWEDKGALKIILLVGTMLFGLSMGRSYSVLTGSPRPADTPLVFEPGNAIDEPVTVLEDAGPGPHTKSDGTKVDNTFTGTKDGTKDDTLNPSNPNARPGDTQNPAALRKVDDAIAAAIPAMAYIRNIAPDIYKEVLMLHINPGERHKLSGTTITRIKGELEKRRNANLEMGYSPEARRAVFAFQAEGFTYLAQENPRVCRQLYKRNGRATLNSNLSLLPPEIVNKHHYAEAMAVVTQPFIAIIPPDRANGKRRYATLITRPNAATPNPTDREICEEASQVFRAIERLDDGDMLDLENEINAQR
ncbi:MAG: hypothetical protein ACPGVT_12610 [Maricaulaceae bacterium]